MNALVMGSSVIAVALAPILPIFASAPPAAGGIALVIAGPWGMPAGQVVEAAQLQEIGPVRAPIGVLVAVRDTESVARLYEHGAWFVIDGQRIMDLCNN